MNDRRYRGAALLTALLAGAGLALGGCAVAAPAAAPPAAEAPAKLQEGKDGGPGVVTLSRVAAQRLGIQTAAVTATGPTLVIPYGAVVYQPDGSSWVYVQTRDRTYQRQPITIATISGTQVTLSAGPQPGSLVVSQGAAELVGVETGISGEQ
jgi:hypothetical protein